MRKVKLLSSPPLSRRMVRGYFKGRTPRAARLKFIPTLAQIGQWLLQFIFLACCHESRCELVTITNGIPNIFHITGVSLCKVVYTRCAKRVSQPTDRRAQRSMLIESLASTLVLELGQTFRTIPFLRQWLGNTYAADMEPFLAVWVVFRIIASDHFAERHTLTKTVRRVVLLFAFLALASFALEPLQSTKSS